MKAAGSLTGAWLGSCRPHCNTAASPLSGAAPQHLLQPSSCSPAVHQHRDIYVLQLLASCLPQSLTLLCGTRKFPNISEEAEIREVEGVIFSFPTQKKLDRLEIKFNDIEQGNLTARQPHHHKYRNI